MRALAILVALALSTNAHADSATAAAAFRQGETLAKAGKWADACPLFEASFHADPQLGVLLYLADCHERIGRTASAFAEFNDAIDMARARSDKREAVAKKRADALAPKLAKVTLTAPKKLIPGLAVKRGSVDITVLVGSEIPIDPGEHEIVASAPGYVDWKQTVQIAPGSKTTLEIASLEKVADKPVDAPPAEVREGTLKITTLPTAQIILDGEFVGTGSYEAKVKSGGHTLRVVAGGMRPYQSEVVVTAGETRTIDVPLEKELVVTSAPPVMYVPGPTEERPSFELAVNLESGVKARNDNPLVLAVRVETAFRIGRRVNFGTFLEYGGLQASNACGYDIAGPMPATEFDFGPRNRFTKCWYVMPGLQLIVHILPKRRFEPYVGVMPGFRLGFAEWESYSGLTPESEHSEMFPAVVVGARVGVNYHPTPGLIGWQVGAFLETSVTVFGKEAPEEEDTGGATTFVTFLTGVRSSIAF